VATYSYRCAGCGRFDQRASIGTAAELVDCPTCARPAQRIFTPPMLARTPAGVAALHQLEERSRHEPPVVSGPVGAPRRRQPVTRHPLHSKLPRP
jgi:putative FmdB family regulatory protein